MIGSAACWGGATVLSKGALAQLGPLTLVTGQLIASVAALWVIVLIRGRSQRLDRAGRLASLAGVLEPGLAYGVGMAGLSLSGAAHASAIAASEPLLILALSALLFGTRTGPLGLAAVSLATLGIVVLSGAGMLARPETPAALAAHHGWQGDLLLLGGTALAALYVVATSHWGSTLPPVQLAARQQSVGLALVLLALVAALALGREVPPVQVDGALLVLVAASGIVQYALAFWLYLTGLQTLPVASAALFLALIPVFGSAGAVLLLGEAIGPADLAGTGLIIAALLLGVTGTTPHRRRDHS